MRGIGGSTLRGGQTVFHGIRMWGQMFQAALLFAAFMVVAVPAWTLWNRTTGAEWYAAFMVTVAEAMPGNIGRTGCVRSSAWIWLFSSTQSTRARSGGERYRPMMSRTLSTKCGSLDSLNVSERCGCKPKAPQMRQIVVCERPLSLAIERNDQWVASAGVALSVRSTTLAT